jgi:hypothetical protein
MYMYIYYIYAGTKTFACNYICRYIYISLLFINIISFMKIYLTVVIFIRK